MNISVHPPLALWELGKRDNNEDYIYPAPDAHITSSSGKLFLVCDGVGGMEKGEEASRITCTIFGENIGQFDTISEQDVLDALYATECYFDRYVQENPGAKGMATTLTLLHLHPERATVAHIGDSRIYQVRSGKILFRSKDHSWVQELVEQGLITLEEAYNHPKKNVLTQAIMGGRYPAKPTVQTLEDIAPGDYFFLCSDGIWESVSDEELERILGMREVSNLAKNNLIRSLCENNSRDNYSAYLIQIDQISRTGHAGLESKDAPLVQQSVSIDEEMQRTPITQEEWIDQAHKETSFTKENYTTQLPKETWLPTPAPPASMDTQIRIGTSDDVDNKAALFGILFLFVFLGIIGLLVFYEMGTKHRSAPAPTPNATIIPDTLRQQPISNDTIK